MKQDKFKKPFSLISIALCITIILGTSVCAHESEADISNKTYASSKNSLISLAESVFSQSVTSPSGIGDKSTVFSPFLVAPVRKEPDISSEVSEYLWIFTKVKISDINGNYYLVEINGKDIGYVFSLWLMGGKKTTLKLNQNFDHVYVGSDNQRRLKASYNGGDTIIWSASPEGVVSINQNTGKITGIKPGLATITVRAGSKTDSATVACINSWKEPENSTAKSSIAIKALPDAGSATRGTVSNGTSIIAKGDLADGSGWIYVNAGGHWGFIRLSDFPGIDYVMTEYHYYDKGYNIRFQNINNKTVEDNIFDYVSILNDVMMANFKLKVCPAISPYTSAADQCKIWSYGSIAKNNLASLCPKTREHNTESCLTTVCLRNELEKKYGNGGGTVSKIAWTGHIMSNHNKDRSNSTIGMGSIIMTPHGLVNPNNYSNYSNATIKEENIFTLVHETGHQFELHDHYCAKDFSEATNKCSNKFCSSCYSNTVPKGCIMLERAEINNNTLTDLYCEKCKESITNYIKKNF